MLVRLLFIYNRNNLASYRAGKRIPTEGAAVSSRGKDLHNVAVGCDAGDRDNSPSKRLAKDVDVRMNLFVLTRKNLTGTA